MFSGLVRNIGEVVSLHGNELKIKSEIQTQIGASIAVNGTCLTVTKILGSTFCVDLSEETKKAIAVENLSGFVHLEEALKVGDRFDGHIVQGHIDSVGMIKNIAKTSSGVDFIINFDARIRNLLIPKGSICVDGISLTINEVLGDSFRLTIIPHTFDNTLFHLYKPARRVNLETDIIARSVCHMISNRDFGASASNSEVSWREIERILAVY